MLTPETEERIRLNVCTAMVSGFTDIWEEDCALLLAEIDRLRARQATLSDHWLDAWSGEWGCGDVEKDRGEYDENVRKALAVITHRATKSVDN